MTPNPGPSFVGRIARGYREIGSRVGFLALLVVLSAAVGAAVSLPLWLFATARPAAYTVVVLAAAAAALGAAIVRRVARSGIGWPRVGAKMLAAALGFVKVAILIAGGYAAAAGAARGWLLSAAAGAVAFLAAAVWIGWGMRAGTPPPSGGSGR